MSVYLTQLAADNFHRPNESPLMSPPWSIDAFGDPGLQIVSDVCEGATTFKLCAEFYNGASLPNDQYASATLAAPLAVSTILWIGLRKTDNGSSFFSMPGYEFTLDPSGNWGVWAATSRILFGVLTASPGDVFTIAGIGTTIYAFQNSTQLGSVTNATYSNGSAMLAASLQSSFSGVQISNFAIGSASTTPPIPPPPSYYSVPDSRVWPNASRNVNQTLIYDVQVSSNPAIPPTDDRADGAPIACGDYPSNSRKPGKYGPGEN